MGPFGIQEIAIVLVICLLIFGPRQLPKLGKSVGETIREFRAVGRQLEGNDDDAK